ncbi:hypothetical protein ACFQ4K_20630 [Tistrella bauzanensis]
MSPAAGIDPFLAPPFTAGIDDAVLAVVGLGYVGLPLAVALAASGRRVIGFDIDAARVGRIAAGRDDTGEVDGGGLSAALAAGFRPASDPDALAGAGW